MNYFARALGDFSISKILSTLLQPCLITEHNTISSLRFGLTAMPTFAPHFSLDFLK